MVSQVATLQVLRKSRTTLHRAVPLVSPTNKKNLGGQFYHISQKEESSSPSAVVLCSTIASIGAGLTTLYYWRSSSSFSRQFFHTHTHNKKFMVRLISSAAIHSLTSTSITLCQSGETSKKIPVRFGKSVRLFSSSSSGSTANGIDLDNKEDCPICRKYGQGPCGALFKEWLQCTDDHPGTDPETNEDLHISKCHHLAMPLAKCLEKHQAFYDQIDTIGVENDDDGVDENELQEAWEKVIQELEEGQPKQEKNLPFPSDIQPDLQLRVENNTGMAVFAFCRDKNVDHRPILCAYVKDQNGQLLAAGSREDLWDWHDGWGILRLAVSQETESVTAYAFYSRPDSDELDSYAQTLKLPPRAT